MKNLDSKIFDNINLILGYVQSKLTFLKQNSFLLSHLDKFILLLLISVYVLSTFVQNEVIAVFALLIPCLVVMNLLITKNEKIELERWNFYLILYLLVCLITNFTSSMMVQSFYGFSKTLIYFGFYFALCQYLKSNKKYILTILLAIGLLVSVQGFIGIFQSLVQVEGISTWQDTSYLNPEDVLSRVYGTLKPLNPNLLAGYMISGVASWIAIGSVFFIKKHYKLSIVSFICLLVSLFTIFLTGCRASYIALFCMILITVLASFQIVYNSNNLFLKKIWNKIISIGCICSIGFLFLNHKIFTRLMSIFLLRGDSSTSFRFNVYNSAIQMFQDNWLWGIGVGNKVFREIYGLYMLSGFDALSCYCVFLEMAVESGIIALILYVLFLISILKAGIQRFLNSNDLFEKILIFVPIVSIIATMVHGLFDTIYFRPQVQFVFWTMAAILTVLISDRKKLS